MTPERILALDIDGVLNSQEYFNRTREQRDAAEKSGADADARMDLHFDPTAIAHLNAIIKITHANVVITSSMRLVHTVGSLRRAMRRRGFEYIEHVVGKTPYSSIGDSTNRRGIEIQMWLDQCGFFGAQFHKLAILDDDSDMGDLMPYLANTSWQYGLQAHHAEHVVKLLMP